ncbi:DNA/pantothenate metabolism flavoprotein domain protein [Verrucomicrobia bacterium]|nr:DNA/pantothenate metabolism flavoprotein domain protein [bacterium]MDA7866500.1 DNA/pantothenate metabolism flavoprotein domain protein [Verrucomicrobiota bacterium]MDB4798012.1 DNA/pantothenate metabolism flavoprotein domain protein [Verrucomicrobiota bacterium]
MNLPKLKAIVTVGPTYEPLDEVRRLTNHSTGRLGTELANYLTDAGFSVTLLKGYYTTYNGRPRVEEIIPFTTTDSLATLFLGLSKQSFSAIFHAAAVSDFKFGNIQSEAKERGQEEPKPGKWGTRSGNLIAELIPTKKILRELRPLFPNAFIAGWKYEVDGNSETAIRKSLAQLDDNKTNLSVVNGPAYGEGFGIIEKLRSQGHTPSHEGLFKVLVSRLQNHIEESERNS